MMKTAITTFALMVGLTLVGCEENAYDDDDVIVDDPIGTQPDVIDEPIYDQRMNEDMPNTTGDEASEFGNTNDLQVDPGDNQPYGDSDADTDAATTPDSDANEIDASSDQETSDQQTNNADANDEEIGVADDGVEDAEPIEEVK